MLTLLEVLDIQFALYHYFWPGTYSKTKTKQNNTPPPPPPPTTKKPKTTNLPEKPNHELFKPCNSVMESTELPFPQSPKIP